MQPQQPHRRAYHRGIELGSEQRRGEERIGTTSRGIGPCYESKMARSGSRVVDCLDPDVLAQKVEANVVVVNKILEHLYDRPRFDAEEIIESYRGWGERLVDYATDTALWLDWAFSDHKAVLFEGAQGTHLDVDHGTYPFVTSSNATSGGVCSGLGIGPTRVGGVLGVAKAYTTRVGQGPFPSQLDDELGEHLRDVGQEYGATTGRPRRCGSFDAVAVRYAVRVNGCGMLALTKLDVPDGLDEIPVCVAYEVDGTKIEEMPARTANLEKVAPIIETLPGWEGTTADATSWDDLPENARAYVERLGELVGCPIDLISVGADRSAMIRRQDSTLGGWLRND